MNDSKFSATMGTRLAILMLALLAALAAGQALSAQPAGAICPEPPCKPVSEPVRQPTGTGSDERHSQNVFSSVAKLGSPNSAAETIDRTLAYWTPQRMANATPVSPPTHPPRSMANPDQPLQPNSSSRPSTGAAPVLPSDHADKGSRRGEGTGAITLYQAFGQEWTGPLTLPPATVNGVLFYSYKGKDYRCSASTVNSPAKNLAFTAGSCVHRGGQFGDWHDNVVFAPGYRDGSRPHGTWVARELWSNSAWTNSSDQGYNYGAVVFFTNASGQRLVNVVGANGIAFNYPAEQDTYTFGYSNQVANGERLVYCSGTSTGGGIFDPRRKYLKCDLGSEAAAGKSRAKGGPWVMDFDGELGYQHSITTGSKGTPSGSEVIGIVFDNNVESFYNAVSVRF